MSNDRKFEKPNEKTPVGPKINLRSGQQASLADLIAESYSQILDEETSSQDEEELE